MLFACILMYVPAAPSSWRDVRVGAVVTALLFAIGKWALGTYLGKASPGSGHGAAGSLVVLVLWVYDSAQIFYLGAEFTPVHALANSEEVWAGAEGGVKKGRFERPRQSSPNTVVKVRMGQIWCNFDQDGKTGNPVASRLF